MCVRVCVCVCVHECVHVYTHMYVHAYGYACMCTCVRSRILSTSVCTMIKINFIDHGNLCVIKSSPVLDIPIVPAQISTLGLTKALRSGKPALRASWNTPSSDTSILSYQVHYKNFYSSTWKTKTSTSTYTYLENLSAGSTYQVKVRAVSGAGSGLYSFTRSIRTHAGMLIVANIYCGMNIAVHYNNIIISQNTAMFLLHYIVPAKISTLTLTTAARSGRPALRVSWRAPSSETSILSYQVQYRALYRSYWTTKTLTSTYTYLENLSPGSSYQVQVRAVSSVGSGAYSTVRTLRTYSGIQ